MGLKKAISEAKKWINVAKYLQSVELIESRDWKTLKIASKDHRDYIVRKVIDTAAKKGALL